jgi:hypothetical protein
MTVPKVFVASSSEGLDVVDAVCKLLRQDLGKKAVVTPWPSTFQLTKAYIESLEGLLYTVDFAVLVLTPDDVTRSREAERFAPRDNVVFELGLFFGRLGRERCFFLQRSDLDLKLPSDLLGIEPASYSMSPGALDSACARIGKAIRDAITTLPTRPRLGDAERAAQADMRRFGDRITGTWWERILLNGEESGLSFVTIELDDAHSSVRLGGKAYGPDGVLVATWRSKAARLEVRRVLYVRECQRRDIKTRAWRPGLAEVNFVDSSEGEGTFWESDESNPGDTVVKDVELRRTRDKTHASTMQKGSDAEKQALVLKMRGAWR